MNKIYFCQNFNEKNEHYKNNNNNLKEEYLIYTAD